MYNNRISKMVKIVLALCSTMAMNYYFLYSTGNVLNIIVFIVFLFLYTKFKFPNIKERLGICSFIGAGVTAITFTAGKVGRTSETILDALSRYKESVVKDEYASIILLSGYSNVKEKLVLAIMLIGLWIVSWFLIAQVMKHITHNKLTTLFGYSFQSANKLFWIMFISLIVCWIPYFIINFPGVLTFDSIYQISQVEGDSILNSKHPVLHTMLIALCYKFGILVSGNSNIGVALYTIVQMGILALIYSYMIKTLYTYGLKIKWCILILLYFAIIPFNAMYAITMWKDILFAGFVAWFLTILFRLFICGDLRNIVWFLLPISGFLMISFRSNGLIAFVVCCPILLLMIKEFRKKLLVMLAIPIILNCIITGPVYSALGVQSDNIVEALSIPLQHISRVVVNCEDELSASQVERIEKLAPLQEIKNTYNCRFADPIKNLMWSYGSEKVIDDNKWDFFKLWFELGVSHPVEYILAEIDATLGYWNSDVQYNVIELGGYPNEYGIHWIFDTHPEYWGKLYNWCNMYRKIPLLGSLYSMGTAFLIMVFIMIIYIYLKQYKNLIVSMPVLFIWGTIMIAAPLHSEMRYVYSLMVSIPLIVGDFVLHTQMITTICPAKITETNDSF